MHDIYTPKILHKVLNRLILRIRSNQHDWECSATSSCQFCRWCARYCTPPASAIDDIAISTLVLHFSGHVEKKIKIFFFSKLSNKNKIYACFYYCTLSATIHYQLSEENREKICRVARRAPPGSEGRGLGSRVYNLQIL